MTSAQDRVKYTKSLAHRNVDTKNSVCEVSSTAYLWKGSAAKPENGVLISRKTMMLYPEKFKDEIQTVLCAKNAAQFYGAVCQLHDDISDMDRVLSDFQKNPVGENWYYEGTLVSPTRPIGFDIVLNIKELRIMLLGQGAPDFCLKLPKRYVKGSVWTWNDPVDIARYGQLACRTYLRGIDVLLKQIIVDAPKKDQYKAAANKIAAASHTKREKSFAKIIEEETAALSNTILYHE